MGRKISILLAALLLIVAGAFTVHAEPGPAVSSADVNLDETQMRIELSGYTLPEGSALSAGVWCDGTSDIKWFPMSKSGESYTADVQVKEFARPGKYFAHVYADRKTFIGGTEFTVSDNACSDIHMENFANASGTCDLVADSITCISGIESVSVEAWTKEDKSDLHTYTAEKDASGRYVAHFDIKNHSSRFGSYHTAVYVKGNNGVETNVGNLPDFSYSYTGGTVTSEPAEGGFKATASGIEVPGGLNAVAYAVWSDKDGLDDLKWYEAAFDETAGTSSVSYPASDFGTYGLYHVHVYGVLPGGEKLFLSDTSYTVEAPAAGSVEANPVGTDGGFEVVIKGLTCPAGLKSVSVPVWSEADQKDIVWYKAELNSDGNYAVASNVSKHKNNAGPFNVHVYVEDNTGKKTFVGSAVLSFPVKADVKADKSGGFYHLQAANIQYPSDDVSVRFAVWSEDGGQDDLVWLDASKISAEKTADFKLNIKNLHSYGKYFVHAYAVNAAGKYAFLGATEFTIEKPAFSDLKITTDQPKGSFKISLDNLTSESGIDSVRIAVWSSKDQSNLQWYDAVKDSSGSYSVSSSISKHKYALETYHAHVYIKEKSGISSFLTAKDFSFQMTHKGVSVDGGVDETIYTAAISELTVPCGAKKVMFAVWSSQGGQDDIKWYSAEGTNGGDYSVKINIKNHKTSGKYLVHVYVQNQADAMVYAGAGEFSVNSSASAAIAVSDVKEPAGTYKVTVTLNAATSPVSKVEVPVWTKSNQSDVYWYNAAKQSDGTWAVTVDIRNHKLNTGTFNIHVYPTFSNGIRSFAGSATYHFAPKNFVGVLKNGNGTRQLILKNADASVTDVQFAAWSSTGGMSDCCWYKAQKQSDGTWIANFNTNNHRHYGTYTAHCYVNNKSTCVGGATFQVDQSEMRKNGWFYENGYKFYYINDELQRDVRGIIGPQPSYYIEINRVCNTVTVYAQDGGNGYIIPVCAFACSVGLPGTSTPTGTFYTDSKHRWKYMMGPSWAQYATGFLTAGGYYMHSVAGWPQSTHNLNPGEYNKLGSPASHGCVRLCVRDAKWIYENCSLGTRVFIYDGASPGPLGKPATIKIPAWQNWDPTDPEA